MKNLIILPLVCVLFSSENSFAQNGMAGNFYTNNGNDYNSYCQPSVPGNVYRLKRISGVWGFSNSSTNLFNQNDPDSSVATTNCNNTSPCHTIVFKQGCYPSTGDTPVQSGAYGTHVFRLGGTSSTTKFIDCNGTSNGTTFTQMQCPKGCMGGKKYCNACGSQNGVIKVNCGEYSAVNAPKYENGCYLAADAHGSTPRAFGGKQVRTYSCSPGTGFVQVPSICNNPNNDILYVKNIDCKNGCANGACTSFAE